jgi:hypothetical protein
MQIMGQWLLCDDGVVLGRDILNLFAVIVDRPADIVCLISQRHCYKIEEI